MSFWLLKTEPGTYAFSDLERDGKTRWDGVSNNLALKNLRMMTKGDLVLIYHTGEERSIVGIAEVVSAPYADPKAKDSRLVVVDIKAKKALKTPVPLSEIRKKKELSDFVLVRLPRLSVMPVTEKQWNLLLQMAT